MCWTFDVIIAGLKFTTSHSCSREQADACAKEIMIITGSKVEYYQEGLKYETLMVCE